MAQTSLQTSSERLDKDRVKLRIEVSEDALQPSISAVYRRWANEIKVPGFRKGKIPKQLIDQRVGVQTVREEALRDALPDIYREALAAEELEAIAPPEIEVVEFEAGQPLVFEALVDVRPDVGVPDLASITVDHPSVDVTSEDLAEQLNRLADRFAELEAVGREAGRGDYALIDLNASQNGRPVEEASAPDLLYEIGSRAGPPRLDGELEGTRPGAILKFNDTLPPEAGELGGKELSFTVLVKEVKAKRLPALDDEFAKTVGDYDTLGELEDELRSRLAVVKRELATDELRGLVLEALVDRAELQPPDKLVEAELEHRREHLEDDLAKAGLSLDDYARGNDVTELEIRAQMRRQAERSVTAELLLEEVARREEVEVSETDLGQEVAIAAARAQRDPQEVAKQLVDNGRLGAVAADIMRRKALDYVVANVNVVGWPPKEGSDDG